MQGCKKEETAQMFSSSHLGVSRKLRIHHSSKASDERASKAGGSDIEVVEYCLKKALCISFTKHKPACNFHGQSQQSLSNCTLSWECSKRLIVDNEYAIVGSACIKRRSMEGSRIPRLQWARTASSGCCRDTPDVRRWQGPRQSVVFAQAPNHNALPDPDHVAMHVH